MKKVFLFLTMLLFAFTGTMKAGVDVEVGTGSTTNSYLPDYTYYDYAVSQQIYTAAEIGMGGTINAISFDVASGSATRLLNVYMKHVTRSTFTGTSNWESMSDDDMVYSGNVSWAAGWVTITLDSPFEYNGTDNLLLCVYDNTGSYVSSPSYRVYSSTNAALRVYRDNTPYDVTSLSGGARISYKNHIKFNMELGPAAIAVTPSTIDLGLRPSGAWMKPVTATLSNTGSNATVSLIETNNNFFTVETQVPFAVNFGEPVTFNVGTGTADAGVQNGQLVIAYTEDRGFTTVDVTAEAYNPVAGDVAETAINVTAMPYNDNAPSGIYKNYDLPTATAGADAVYKVTFDNDVMFSAGTNGANPAVALYTEDFNGVGGPDANNNYVYTGPEVGPGPVNMWYSYSYTGITTAFGYPDAGTLLYGYEIPASYLQELGLGNCAITTIESALLNYGGTYLYFFILKGGDTPDLNNLVYEQEVEDFTLGYYFDLTLDEPQFLGDDENIWIMFMTDNTRAYCGRYPVDPMDQIWYSRTGSTWYSGNYTPIIYTRFLELPTGREVTVNPANISMRAFEANENGEISAIDGTAMGAPKAQMAKANRGNRTVETVLEEGFEGGDMPTGWTSEGDSYWQVGTGDYSSSTAATGSYNALITHSTSGNSTYLVTPAMDLSSAASASLSFAYVNRSWAGDIDGFGVYYRVNGGAWTELFYTSDNHESWTTNELSLSGLAANYQIGFLMYDSWGYGVGVDDVVVTADITSGGGGGATYQIADMFVPAGTYYVAVASTDDNFSVDMMTSEIPVPEQAVVVYPYDGETNVETPYLAEWILGDYTTEMQVLVGTQYPPQAALIDWTSDLVEAAFLMDLEPNQTYFMQVNARNDSGTTMGEIYAFSTPIDPVEGFAVEESQLYPGDAAVFTWDANRTLMGYNLYQDGVKVNNTPITGTSYAVEDLEYNITGYNFQIAAVYTAGESALSAPVTVYMTGFGTVSGTVYEQDSTTVIPNAIVEFRGTDVYGTTQVIGTTADENGVYTCEVLEGNFTPVAYKDGYAECAASAMTVAYAETYNDVNIYVHEFYYPLGMITATEEENDVLVEWDWTPASLFVDFETGDFSQADFNNESSTYPWVITTTNPYEGTYCMKSTCEGIASADSYIEATVDVPFDAMVGFWVRVSSESNYDKFNFYIDGVQQGASLSGQLAYQYKEFAVTEGTHTYKWQYIKDSSVNSNDDCVYVDNITMYMQAPPAPSGMTYNFDDGTMQGWTVIDSDGDGNGWDLGSAVMGAGYGHNSSSDLVLSKSYDNSIGVLTPDNYLVSPSKIAAQNGAAISFWACAQDASYAAEHFGVAVSTGSNTNASDFTTIQEWTMTAKGPQGGTSDDAASIRGTRAQGSWYQYTVDLSSYAGQEIWVAIRHFNCSDWFYLDVDDITLGDGSEVIARGDNRTLQSFNLYRRNNVGDDTPELIATPASDVFEYTDAAWTTLPYGEYQWGIQATYEGNAPVQNRDEVLFSDDFEGGDLSNWTLIDADGDGYTWQIGTPASYGIGDAHSGTYVATSWSWNGASYDPDQYMISPLVEGATSIEYYVATNTGYPDHYGIFVSSTGTNAGDFTEVFSETAPIAKGNGTAVKSSMINGGGTRDLSPWTLRNIDVPTGTKYIAFRHYDSYDMNYLFIDDVVIYGGSAPVPPTPVPAGDGLSEIIWSNVIEKDMEATMTFNVALNNAQNPDGAVVTVVGENNDYTATVAEGTAEIVVRKGDTYDITVSLEGYASYTATEFVENDEYEYDVVLEEIIAPVDGLYVSPTGWAKWDVGTVGPVPPTPPTGEDLEYGFEADEEGWTSIDADGDGYEWFSLNPTNNTNNIPGHNGSVGHMTSASYQSGALTPDNYLVSPEKAAYTQISFWACGQDALWAAEHFGVAVSTTGNTSAADFTTIQEWTLTAKDSGIASVGREGQTRDQGAWYEYTVDLSSYAGQDIWVAIRHFNCTDMFRINVDDVTLSTGSKGDRAPLTYKVMLDGTYVGETTNCGYQHDVEGMEEGSEHVTAVAPLYASGMGDWMTYEWTYSACSNYAGTTEYNAEVNGSDVTLSWTLPGGTNPNPPTPPTGGWTEDFESGSLPTGWATIDADGDGYNWTMASTAMGTGYGHNGSSDMIFSQSYNNNIGALNPDNYLVTSQVTPVAGSTFSFWACAQDNAWASEHFGVAISTGSQTNASDFTTIQEWTMTAKDSGVMAPGRDGETRTQGNWYQYSVDLSSYAGQAIYIAIRHFNCTDWFYLDVDDVAFTTSAKSNRDMWDLVYEFDATSGYQYGVASDGTNIYTSSWSSSSTSMFYKYDMEGNFVEEFNISGCGQLRGMTYDGQYFYGVANAATIYCVDLANHTLVSTTTSAYGAMRAITYDPVRDGFWVVGNWSGNLTLVDRTGAIVQAGPAPSSASDVAYYKDTDNVEHIFCFNNSDNGVYDYNITTNTLATSAVFNFSTNPLVSGTSGGCFVGTYDNKTCFFGDIQQSPQHIAIYELDSESVPPVPSGDILGALIFRDGELLTPAPIAAQTFVDNNVEEGEHEYCIRVVYSDYAMSCPECLTVEIGATSCEPVTNLVGEEYHNEYDGILLEWDAPAGALSYNIYQIVSGVSYLLGNTPENGVIITDVPVGTYTLGVTAVYTACESDMVTVTVTYSNVEESEIVNAIYPNPTSGDLHINATAMTRVSVYNAMGQMVYDQAIDGDETVINMGQFEAGVYMVNIVTENGSTVKRITVVK